MNIHENTALLDAFVDGELTSEEMISVQSHLDECPECRAYVDDALAIRASFPTEDDAELSADFAETVMKAVAETPQSRPKKRQPWGKLAAAAACLAVIVTVWFHVSRRRSELGLRMAMGSTRRGIEGLMIGEGLLLLASASVPGLLIILNLAVADIVPCGVIRFTAISLLTGGVLALVVFLAIWYPARKAARQEPADALRYDG